MVLPHSHRGRDSLQPGMVGYGCRLSGNRMTASSIHLMLLSCGDPSFLNVVSLATAAVGCMNGALKYHTSLRACNTTSTNTVFPLLNSLTYNVCDGGVDTMLLLIKGFGGLISNVIKRNSFTMACIKCDDIPEPTRTSSY